MKADLITLEEAAQMLAMSRWHLYHIYQREFNYYRIGRSIRLSRAELDKWIRAKAHPSQTAIQSAAALYCINR